MGSNTALIKRLIGIALLLVGLWVVYDGFKFAETLTMVLGAASLFGGLAFFFIRPRHAT